VNRSLTHIGSAKKRIYNAQVFNLSDPAELKLYVAVMREYGDYLLQSPPPQYFSSKTESIHVFLDWMSEYDFEDEFINKTTKPTTVEAGDSGEQGGSPESALARLAARLQAKSLPSPEDGTDDGSGDPEQP
jgi:hypothetical protein